MVLVERPDCWSTPARILATVLGFVIWWPLGLATLAYMLWSRKMGRWGHCGSRRGGWTDAGYAQAFRGGCGWWGGRGRDPRPTGNSAFDDYRAETLRRLEDDQREFLTFLDRLRRARDKTEFDQFMAERDRRPLTPEPPEPPTHA